METTKPTLNRLSTSHLLRIATTYIARLLPRHLQGDLAVGLR